MTDSIAAAGAPPELETFTFVGKPIYVKEGRCYDAMVRLQAHQLP